ncbi:MAG TPA: TetR/AcrR family transcriptional regulator [Methylocystis sp.]|nr:TetR/AcrR family transcriptional regulator [Methylocystis sp.]
MRVTREKAAENRRRILRSAAQLIRERGVSGVGVDTLAASAGLTYGGLYSQFGSKEALAAEALSVALAGNLETLERLGLAAYTEGYLSAEHRDAPGQGCALAALGCDMPREGAVLRRRFTEGFRRLAESISAGLRRESRQESENEALATLAALVGTVILARAVDEPELSEQILAATRASLASGGTNAERAAPAPPFSRSAAD